MKKLIFTCALALFGWGVFGLTAQAQKVPSAPNKWDKKGEKHGEWVERFDSTWSTLSDTSRTPAVFYRKIAYKNGKPVGPVRDYYLDGTLQMEGPMVKDGRPEAGSDDLVYEGEFRFFHPNSQLHTLGKFIQNVRVGVWPIYDAQGKEIYRNDYGEPLNGWLYYYEHAPDLVWKSTERLFEQGILKEKIEYKKNGVRSAHRFYTQIEKKPKESMARMYYLNGQLAIEESYDPATDIALDDVKVFDPDGKPISVDSWTERKMNGVSPYSETDVPTMNYPQPINMDDIKRQLNYPKSCQKAGIQGKVRVKVLVGVNGGVDKVIVKESPHALLTDEVMKQIYNLKSVPTGWRSYHVPCWITLPFDFKLH